MQEHIFYNALNILLEGAIITKEKEYHKFKTFKSAWEHQNNKDIDPEKEYQKLKQSNISLILINDKEYPSQLKEISHPPLGIYVKGNIDILKQKNDLFLAVIGSRKMSDYGKKVCEQTIKDLSSFNFTIISGLAYGMDACAHESAINNKLKTIAVLGSGIENIYPATNIPLANNIIKNGGCLVSEYPINSKAKVFYFPQRNRIISGLSRGILIIEAKEKSGSLITARFALDQNRDVSAIPNSIYEENSLGTNKLIQSGAKLIINPKDILEEFNLSS